MRHFESDFVEMNGCRLKNSPERRAIEMSLLEPVNHTYYGVLWVSRRAFWKNPPRAELRCGLA
jgi:hypothetical protein